MNVTSLVGKFPTGQILISQGAHAALSKEEVFAALVRHVAGVWGDLCEQDRDENDAALKYGGRLLSRYCSQTGTIFWIITEYDRSVTTVLLPEEY